MRSLAILMVVMYSGVLYYIFSMSKSIMFNRYAFLMKLFYLLLSFILAFVQQDQIVIGELAFGGRASVMILILIEIMDTFIDKKKEDRKISIKITNECAECCHKNK